jgi:hypothetical protein
METKNEIWKPIKDYEGLYEVSNYGRVRSVDHVEYIPHPRNPLYIQKRKIYGRIKKLRHHKAGYWITDLYKENIGTTKTVHRLVAEAFIPNPQNKPEVNHIDENKENSRVENLEWCSRVENVRHGTALTRMGRGHWTPVIQMTKDGTFVKRWDCMQEAADKLGLHMTHISAVCRGRSKSHGGFLWRYPDENGK